MKQIGILVLAIFVSLIQVRAQTDNAKSEMVFDKTVNGITAHDFGSIVYGANGKIDFTFTNKGTKPLAITDVKSSCGCTIPNWTKEPVEPGKTGIINIEYNTKLPGIFNKTVVVYSNANNSPVRLEVRGKVNAQVSDLKPGSSNGGKSNATSIVSDSDDRLTIVPKDSASKAEAAMISKARKAAQEESMKKLMEKPKANQKTGDPITPKPVTNTEKIK
jgi:hypothetical protein